MSLFGSLLGDFEDDPIFGHHMRSMRQMNSIMSTLMSDPFGMMGSPFVDNGGFPGMPGNRHSALTHGPAPQHRPPVMANSLMPFGFQSMPNINSLLNGGVSDYGDNNGASFCSSSFVSMTSGPDGRPQVYQATSSSKSGPGGVRETRKTVQDSRTGLKKMAIGHHIGERAHIIERERNLREGTEEENQEFINLEEEQAEDFDREFTNRARSAPQPLYIGSAPISRPALPAPPSSDQSTPSRRTLRNAQKVTARRALRTPTSSPLALPRATPSSRLNATSSSKSVRQHPYITPAARRNHHQHHHQQQQQHHHQHQQQQQLQQRLKNTPSQTNTNNSAPTTDN